MFTEKLREKHCIFKMRCQVIRAQFNALKIEPPMLIKLRTLINLHFSHAENLFYSVCSLFGGIFNSSRYTCSWQKYLWIWYKLNKTWAWNLIQCSYSFMFNASRLKHINLYNNQKYGRLSPHIYNMCYNICIVFFLLVCLFASLSGACIDGG